MKMVECLKSWENVCDEGRSILVNKDTERQFLFTTKDYLISLLADKNQDFLVEQLLKGIRLVCFSFRRFSDIIKIDWSCYNDIVSSHLPREITKIGNNESRDLHPISLRLALTRFFSSNLW